MSAPDHVQGTPVLDGDESAGLHVYCKFCEMEVDPFSGFVWRQVVGWERKARDPARKGGSDIALREPLNEFACGACIDHLKRGLSPSQGVLL